MKLKSGKCKYTVNTLYLHFVYLQFSFTAQLYLVKYQGLRRPWEPYVKCGAISLQLDARELLNESCPAEDDALSTVLMRLIYAKLQTVVVQGEVESGHSSSMSGDGIGMHSSHSDRLMGQFTVDASRTAHVDRSHRIQADDQLCVLTAC